MADKRKLQGEIDRCLKKVQEGVETFEDIWQKVHNSANSNQKEKYEADLKKEIKKLQRQRDQIKTWLASSEIKDKRALVDNRKLIETQMERFKVVERETKTKAYSKEGLGAASKLDPAAKEKNEITQWISQAIESLNIQMDQLESELEQMSSGKKNKRLDKDRSDRFESLKTIQERHAYHIKKMETIMRMVDNDAIPLEQIKMIREDMEYYVESNREPDFEENDFLYDELDLEELDTINPANSPPNDDEHGSDKLSATPTSTNSSSPSPSPGFNHNHSKEDDRKRHKSIEDQKNKNNSEVLISTTNLTARKQPLQTPTKISQSSNSIENNGTVHLPNSSSQQQHGWFDSSQNSNSGSPLPSRNQNNVPSVWQRTSSASGAAMKQLNFTDISSQAIESKSQSNTVNHIIGHMSVPNSVIVNSLSTSSNSSVVKTVSSNIVGNPLVVTSAAPAHNGLSGKESIVLPQLSTLSLSVAPTPSQSSAVNSNNNSISTSLSSLSLTQSSAPSSSTQANAMNSLVTSLAENKPVIMNGPLSILSSSLHQDPSAESMSSLKSIAQQAVMNAGLETQIPTVSESSSTDTKVPFNSSGSQMSPKPSTPSQDGSNMSQGPQTNSILLNRFQGCAPLGPVPLTKEHYLQLSMQEAAYHHLPHPSDSERLRHYLPRNPIPTPAFYPQLPPPHVDSVEFFQRLSTETLFFIFYYMEGTKAQYLAAKALKKQSWRFHTKYLMWFQRHEEPKTINEDYEQGTYVYFDYEKWGQRKKEGFTFEYRYLEDRDLN